MLHSLSVRLSLLAVTVAGCGGRTEPWEDAGPSADAGLDAGDGGRDAGADAGRDAGSDGGDDAGPDAGLDAGFDAGDDAGSDAGFDGGFDGGDDAGTDGGGPECDAHADCDDGLYCNGSERCAGGTCVGGVPIACADFVDCTQDVCDEAADRCVSTPVDARCDDGRFCNGPNWCDPVFGCANGVDPNCDDGVGCTTDACDEAADRCVSTPQDARCDDGLFCTGTENCDAAVGCTNGPDPICADGVACTDDACDEAADRCAFAPVDARCDDGLFCTGTENCDAARGCVDGADPNCNDGVACTDDACDEAANRCAQTPVDARCDDGLFCTGTENCDARRGCVDGADPNCDDGVDCTNDVCDEAANRCTSSPLDALCDDGLFCTGTENCDAALDCVAGVPPSCDDTVGCTIDFCGPRLDACVNLPIDFFCDDGLACTGTEFCDPDLDCQSDGPPDCDDFVGCTIDFCDEFAGGCQNFPDDAACDDGLVCTGFEWCDPFFDCQADVPPDCDDFVGCTLDLCDEGSGGCRNFPDDAACDDGLVCTGFEWCDPFFDCQADVPPDCDDFVGCTDDSCDEAALGCTNTPNDANCLPGELCDPLLDCVPAPACFGDADCDDGFFCTGVETCVGGFCALGAPPACDDGVGCTIDFCDFGADACDSFADDAACDDGRVCNGDEFCDAFADCQAGFPLDCDDFVDCTDDTCDEAAPGCVNAPNDRNCALGEVCDPFVGCV